jgi:RNA-binding protein 26
MKIRNSHALKTWLEERLERLCEADPAALSKYVLALIQKEKELSDLKRSCTEQLEVFLGGGKQKKK